MALTMTVTFGTNVFAAPVSDSESEQQSIINQNRDLQGKAKQNVDSIQGKIEAIDNQIHDTNLQISANKTQIASNQTNIKVAEQSIKDAEANLAKEQEVYNQRLRAIYIHGNGGGSGDLKILLESKGMSDFLSRLGTIKKISQLDKKITTDLKNQRVAIENKKDTLQKDNIKLATLLNDNNQKLSKLQTDQQAQTVLIAQAKQESNKYASKIADATAEIKRMTASVPKMGVSRGATAISSNAIVAYANNFIGCEYVYGANGPTTFDCSGFTCYVFRHFGVGLNRVASDQARQGSAVSSDQLQPGDLVFFGSSRNISHVGIYVGGGCYIHAPHTGTTVQISPLNRSDFVCARRVY